MTINEFVKKYSDKLEIEDIVILWHYYSSDIKPILNCDDMDNIRSLYEIHKIGKQAFESLMGEIADVREVIKPKVVIDSVFGNEDEQKDIAGPYLMEETVVDTVNGRIEDSTLPFLTSNNPDVKPFLDKINTGKKFSTRKKNK